MKKNGLTRAQSRGFTLIELLISIFIFSIVLVMGASSLATSFVSGRLYSNSSKDINRDVTSIFETIQSKVLTSQKWSNGTITINGFKVGVGILAIANIDQCTFIGLKSPSDGVLYIKQEACSVLYDNANTFSDRLSSKNLTVTSFDLGASNEYASGSAPYLTVNINAKDIKNSATANFVNTFTLPYAVLKTF